MNDAHYLKNELDELVSKETVIFDFLQNYCLDGLWYWDLKSPENEWMDARFWKLLGYDEKERSHLAKEWQDLINPDDLKVAIDNFQKHCADPSHFYDQIVRYRHKNGKTIWVRCRGIAIRDKQGKAIRMLGVHNDITDLKESEEKLRQLSRTDQLTGLANRHHFRDHFDWAAKNLSRNPQPVSFAIIDIDHFKNINDTYGHQIGDSVLMAVASAIRQAIRENDFLARWGGDEFLVLLHATDADQSLLVAERIKEYIGKINVIEQKKISASIGVSTYVPSTTKIPTNLLEIQIEAADKAMFVAKGKR